MKNGIQRHHIFIPVLLFFSNPLAYAQETIELITTYTRPAQSGLFSSANPLLAATNQYVYFDSSVNDKIVTNRYDPKAKSTTAIVPPESVALRGDRSDLNVLVEPSPGLVVTDHGIAKESDFVIDPPLGVPGSGLSVKKPFGYLRLIDEGDAFVIVDFKLVDVFDPNSPAIRVTLQNYDGWLGVKFDNLDVVSPAYYQSFIPAISNLPQWLETSEIFNKVDFGDTVRVGKSLVRGVSTIGPVDSFASVEVNGEFAGGVDLIDPYTDINMAKLGDTVHILTTAVSFGCAYDRFSESDGYQHVAGPGATADFPADGFCSDIVNVNGRLYVSDADPTGATAEENWYLFDPNALTFIGVTALPGPPASIVKTVAERRYWIGEDGKLWGADSDGQNPAPVDAAIAQDVGQVHELVVLNDELYFTGVTTSQQDAVWRMSTSSVDPGGEDPSEGFRILTTPDRIAPGDYGWIQYPNGSVHWIDEECRERLAAAGLAVVATEWSDINANPLATVQSCSTILATISGDETTHQGFLATTPDNRESGYAWYVEDGTKQWIPEACRNKLSQSLATVFWDWSELSQLPDGQLGACD